MTTLLLCVLLTAQPANALEEARALRREGRLEEALASFRRVPDPPAFQEAFDREARAEWRRRLEERVEAQWGIVVCLLRLDRPADALPELAKARTPWSRARAAWCGNAHAQFRAETLAGEGVCLERLGRPAEALAKYFEALEVWTLYEDPRIAARIVALYRIAGREAALREELVRRDAAYLKTRPSRTHPGPDDPLRFSPTRPVRRILEGESSLREIPRDPEVPFPPLPKRLALP